MSAQTDSHGSRADIRFSAAAWTGLLQPRTIALVGASPGSGFFQCVVANAQQLGYRGRLIPVNPARQEVYGLPSVSRVSDADQQVDLAAISVKAAAVEDVIADALAAGVRAFVLHTAGFAETGAEGEASQDRLRQMCLRAGATLIGPNGLGFATTRTGVPTFGVILPGLQPGGIGLISQSGSAAITIVSSGRGLGFSLIASTGNEAVTSAEDVFEVMLDDEHTSVVGMFLEGLSDGRRFRHQMARAHSLGKTVVALPGGASAAGRSVVQTHTGRLAGDERIVRAALGDLGVLVAATFDEMVEMLVLASARADRTFGTSVGMLGISGGELAVAADVATSVGLALPQLSGRPGTSASRDEPTPRHASTSNPVDLGSTPEGQAAGTLEDRYAIAIDAVADDPSVDTVVIVQDGQRLLSEEAIGWYMGVYRGIVASGVLETERGVIVVSPVSTPTHPTWQQSWDAVGVPVLQGLGPGLRAVRELGAATGARTRADELLRMPDGARVDRWLDELDRSDRRPDETDSRALLAAYDVPLVPARVCTTADEAVAAAGDLGGAVTLKVVSGEILHKSSVGGVALDVRGSEDVSRAFADITARVSGERPDASIRGVLVSPHQAVEIELIVGGLRSETFGPMVMVGLGGVLVELVGDVVFSLAPIGIPGALELLDRLAGGRTPLGRVAGRRERHGIARIVASVGEIICAGERVTSIEVNPLALTDAGPMALDARVVLDG